MDQTQTTNQDQNSQPLSARYQIAQQTYQPLTNRPPRAQSISSLSQFQQFINPQYADQTIKFQELEKQVQSWQDQFKFKDQECKELLKEKALKDQKIEFQEIQISELREQLEEKEQQYQQMFMMFGSNESFERDASDKKMLSSERIESLQNQIQRMAQQHDIELQSMNSKISYFQNKVGELEHQHKMKQRDHTEEINQLYAQISEQESQKIQFIEKFKHSENLRQTQLDEQEAKYRLLVQKHDSLLEDSNSLQQTEFKELQERSEKEIATLKSFYELEKEKLEMRLNEEREKAQIRYNNLSEEYDQKLRDEVQDKEEEIECLQNELRENEHLHQGFVQQIEYDIGLKQQMIETLEKQLSEAKQRMELLENSKYAAFEKQVESFEQQRIESANKIDKLQSELTEKIKSNTAFQNLSDRLKEQLDKLNAECEQNAQNFGESKSAMQEKIDKLKSRVNDLTEENMKLKLQIEREKAQFRQQSEYQLRQITQMQKSEDLLQKESQATITQKQTEIENQSIQIQQLEDKLATQIKELESLIYILDNHSQELRCNQCYHLFEWEKFQEHIASNLCQPQFSKEQYHNLKEQRNLSIHVKNQEVTLYLNKLDLLQDAASDKMSFKLQLPQVLGLVSYLSKREKENEIGKQSNQIQDQLLKICGNFGIKSDKSYLNTFRISIQHFLNDLMRNQYILQTNQTVQAFFDHLQIKNIVLQELQAPLKEVQIVNVDEDIDALQISKMNPLDLNKLNSKGLKEEGSIDYRELQRQLGIE
eukprot:403345203